MSEVYLDNINKLLKEKNISARKMLLDLNFANNLITKWKNGNTPSLDKITAIAEYLDVSVGYLMENHLNSNLKQKDKENIRVLIGNRIAECRKNQSITQNELAENLGKSLRTVQAYESGEIDISLSTLIEISETLKVPLSYLVSCQAQYINLPCAVGDTVFIVENIGNGKKQEKIIVSGMIDRFIIGDLGEPLADICTGDRWYLACSYPKDYFLNMKEAQEMYLKH